MPGGGRRAGDFRDMLGDDYATLISELQRMFPAADDAPANLMFQQHVREVIASLNQRDTPLTSPLDIAALLFSNKSGRHCARYLAVKPKLSATG
ncbi:hypothetical protein ACLK1S_13780 [Escherichia coli]